jgi:hypothetical protein
MKPRAHRAVVVTAAIGMALIAVLVATHWATVRDHVEAWHFQLTRQTETIKLGHDDPVIMERNVYVQVEGLPFQLTMGSRMSSPRDKGPAQVHWERFGQGKIAPVDHILWLASLGGCRVIEQRLPRGTYVVTGYTSPTPSIIEKAKAR